MEAYTGQIILFAGDYAPEGWVPCDGRILSIQAYQALYSLISITYGGDGRTTFCVPDLRSRLPIGQGTGQDKLQNQPLTPRVLGQTLGTETVTLTESQMPAHQHQLMALNTAATSPDPIGKMLAKPINTTPGATSQDVAYFTPPATSPNPLPLAADALTSTGGNQAHYNCMPTQALNYLICLNGIYPFRP